MTVRISELPNLEVGDLTTTSSIVPVVANLGAQNTTYNTSMANIKTYMETGDFNVTGNITANNATILGNLTVDVLTANTQIVANTTTVTSTSNFLDIQTDGNLTLPISDNGFDVGTRMFYYKTAADVAALVWKNNTGRLVWYGNGVGNANTTISGTATVGTMELGQLLASNTTAATSTTTGALIVSGGAGIAGNLHVGTQAVITGNTSGSNLSLSGLVLAQGNISTPARISTGNLNVNTFATIATTLTTGGTATLNALVVNTSSAVGTTLTVGANATVNGLTVNTSGTVTGTLRSFAGIQNTPIGNVTANSGAFTTLSTTAKSTLGANVDVTGNLNPSADVTYYLGNASNRWETIFANTITANATTALYADLAEKYIPDQYYDPGTVVVFGGEQEITVTDQQGDTRVAGAISTQPAYVMNDGEQNGVPVALRGKIPVKVVGSVNKGDLLITSNVSGYATAAKFNKPDPNAVFAKSLVRDDDNGPRVIWAVIL